MSLLGLINSELIGTLSDPQWRTLTELLYLADHGEGSGDGDTGITRDSLNWRVRRRGATRSLKTLMACNLVKETERGTLAIAPSLVGCWPEWPQVSPLGLIDDHRTGMLTHPLWRTYTEMIFLAGAGTGAGSGDTGIGRDAMAWQLRRRRVKDDLENLQSRNLIHESSQGTLIVAGWESGGSSGCHLDAKNNLDHQVTPEALRQRRRRERMRQESNVTPATSDVTPPATSPVTPPTTSDVTPPATSPVTFGSSSSKEENKKEKTTTTTSPLSPPVTLAPVTLEKSADGLFWEVGQEVGQLEVSIKVPHDLVRQVASSASLAPDPQAILDELGGRLRNPEGSKPIGNLVSWTRQVAANAADDRFIPEHGPVFRADMTDARKRITAATATTVIEPIQNQDLQEPPPSVEIEKKDPWTMIAGGLEFPCDFTPGQVKRTMILLQGLDEKQSQIILDEVGGLLAANAIESEKKGLAITVASMVNQARNGSLQAKYGPKYRNNLIAARNSSGKNTLPDIQNQSCGAGR
ncbi:MAG: hypothetical protein HQL65_19885 [Magnetococcales bacterium]|nr:hypothetical protein [Magnetococcales bacterium]